jgi:hypothetical protein
VDTPMLTVISRHAEIGLGDFVAQAFGKLRGGNHVGLRTWMIDRSGRREQARKPIPTRHKVKKTPNIVGPISLVQGVSRRIFCNAGQPVAIFVAECVFIRTRLNFG